MASSATQGTDNRTEPQRPTALSDLWKEFIGGSPVTEAMIVAVSNNLWDNNTAHFVYETLHGVIPGTSIKATFDISSYDVIIEVDDADYMDAVQPASEAYRHIPDFTLCMRATGGDDATNNM